MRKFLATLLRSAARRLQPATPLVRAPRQLEQVRELTLEERDQLATFLQSPAGLALMERGRAIEFRDYQNATPASWRQCLDWITSLSRVPRDNGHEFETSDTEAPHGEAQFRERVSP